MITPEEIAEQVGCAFRKNYSGYGCNESVLMSFCDYECPLCPESEITCVFPDVGKKCNSACGRAAELPLTMAQSG